VSSCYAYERDAQASVVLHILCRTTYHSAMSSAPRIVLDPAILAGKPVIKGTRLSVEFIVGLLAQGWSEADIIHNYQGITHEDILACLSYAHDRLTSERVYPLSA
jgi:uncharacterized protein (DUF433 family)